MRWVASCKAMAASAAEVTSKVISAAASKARMMAGIARGSGIVSPAFPGSDHVGEKFHLLLTAEFRVCEESVGGWIQVKVLPGKQAQDNELGHRSRSLELVKACYLIANCNPFEQAWVISTLQVCRQMLPQEHKDALMQSRTN
jgi:hypothetical protein